MFYGLVVTNKKPATITKSATDMIHISKITVSPKSQGRLYLYVTQNKIKSLLAALDTDANSQISTNLFFLASENPVFSLEGRGEIHLVGYCEPSEFDRARALKELGVVPGDKEAETDRVEEKAPKTKDVKPSRSGNEQKVQVAADENKQADIKNESSDEGFDELEDQSVESITGHKVAPVRRQIKKKVVENDGDSELNEDDIRALEGGDLDGMALDDDEEENNHLAKRQQPDNKFKPKHGRNDSRPPQRQYNSQGGKPRQFNNKGNQNFNKNKNHGGKPYQGNAGGNNRRSDSKSRPHTSNSKKFKSS